MSKKNDQRYCICLLFSTMMVIFLPCLLKAQSPIYTEKADSQPTNILEPFNYGGVSLLDGMFKNQYTQTRDYYFNIANDDILKGFRQQTGLPVPDKHMGGWCSKSSEVVFGQLLSEDFYFINVYFTFNISKITLP